MSEASTSYVEVPLEELLDQPLPAVPTRGSPRREAAPGSMQEKYPHSVFYKQPTEEAAATLDEEAKRQLIFQEAGMRPWYDSLIDAIIAHPDLTIAKIADLLGRPRATVYQVTGSDLFKARLAQRRAAHSEQVSARIHAGLTDLAVKTLDVLKDRVENNPTKIPFSELKDLSATVLDKLGYGAKSPASEAVAQQVNVTVNLDTLRDAQSAMRKLQTINAETVPALPRSAPGE